MPAVPTYDREPEWDVKVRTLEYFVRNPGWRTPEEVRSDVSLEGWEHLISWSKAVPIRLMRYHRAGLLERRREKRKYVYRLTHKGEDRWIFILKRRGLLEPPIEGTIIEKTLWEVRRELALDILEDRLSEFELRRELYNAHL